MGGSPKSDPLGPELRRALLLAKPPADAHDFRVREREAARKREEAQRIQYGLNISRWRLRAVVFLLVLVSIPVLSLLFIGIVGLFKGAFR